MVELLIILALTGLAADILLLVAAVAVGAYLMPRWLSAPIAAAVLLVFLYGVGVIAFDLPVPRLR